MNEYQFKFPDYFKNQDRITNETKLEDFFYEIFNKLKKPGDVCRISWGLHDIPDTNRLNQWWVDLCLL